MGFSHFTSLDYIFERPYLVVWFIIIATISTFSGRSFEEKLGQSGKNTFSNTTRVAEIVCYFSSSGWTASFVARSVWCNWTKWPGVCVHGHKFRSFWPGALVSTHPLLLHFPFHFIKTNRQNIIDPWHLRKIDLLLCRLYRSRQRLSGACRSHLTSPLSYCDFCPIQLWKPYSIVVALHK